MFLISFSSSLELLLLPPVFDDTLDGDFEYGMFCVMQ